MAASIKHGFSSDVTQQTHAADAVDALDLYEIEI